jgi:uncharacterized membrane protein YgcG
MKKLITLTILFVAALLVTGSTSAVNAAPREGLAAEQEAILARFQKLCDIMTRLVAEMEHADPSVREHVREGLNYIAEVEIQEDMQLITEYLRTGKGEFEVKMRLKETLKELDRLAAILVGEADPDAPPRHDPGAGPDVPDSIKKVIEDEGDARDATSGLAGDVRGDGNGNADGNSGSNGDSNSNADGNNGSNGGSDSNADGNGAENSAGNSDSGGQTPEQRRKEIRERQKRIRKDVGEIKKRVTDPYLLKKLGEAEDHMSKAEGFLGGDGEPVDPGKLGKAKDEQNKAIDNLEDVKEQIEKRFEDIKRLKELFDLKELVAFMLKKQRTINEDTDKFDLHRKETMTRADILEIEDITDEQDTLAELARLRSKQLKDRDDFVFCSALKIVSEDMEEAARLLGQSKSGMVVQSIQGDVVVQLELMLEALNKEIGDIEKRLEEENKPRSGSGSGSGLGGGGKDGGSGTSIPPVTLPQLLMMKNMQLEINRKTRKLAAIMETAEDPGTRLMLKGLCLRLAAREAQLADLIKQILDRIEKLKDK